MRYRDRTTGKLKSKKEILKEYSNVSFPKEWDKNIHNFIAADPLIEVEPPSNNNIFKIVRYAGEENIAGNYYQKWEIVDRFTDYVDEDGNTITKQQQQSEYKAKYDRLKGDENRSIRNTLIAETDWWAKVDTTLTDERAAYRQALRDITNHPNWPYLKKEDWPVKPV